MAGWRVSGSDAGRRGVGGADPTSGGEGIGPLEAFPAPGTRTIGMARSTGAIGKLPTALRPEKGTVG